MRKHKSVVAILLAVMMIFTFMPTMAFADTTAKKVTWSGYDSVTVSGCTGSDAIYNGTYDTVKVFQTSDGTVKVDVKDPKIGGVDYDTLKSIVGSKNYYDLNNAAFANGSGLSGVALYDSYASVSAWNSGKPNGILFTAPTGTYTGTTAPTFFKAATNSVVSLDQWNGTITLDPATVTDKGEDMTVKVSADVTWSTGDQTTGIVGALADKTVTVKAAAKGTLPSEFNYYVDEVKGNATASNSVSATYDGAEHTVIAAPVKGYTVKYTVFNTKTGNWDAVDAVTFKDKATVSAAATYFDDAVANDTGKEYRFTINVGEAGRVIIAFDRDEQSGGLVVTEGQYDPWDYVKVVGLPETATSPTNKAVKADMESLLAYCKAAFEIKEDANKFEPSKVVWTITAKDADTVKAAKEEYKELFANYSVDGVALISTSADYTKNVTVITADPTSPYLAEQVAFTKAVTSKTYKGSKTTKKGKLKKNQTIQFTAEANNGATLAYKLVNVNTSKIKIDKSTGKVTVKKGLAKGTYKFKVKAYVVGNAEVCETQNVTLKIKK